MAIWHRNYSLEEVNLRGKGCMVEHLGIDILEMGESHILGRMPVDSRTKQPIGLLHGGASVVLAETLASTAGNLCVNPATHYCVGLEINANHISSARDGFVLGKTFPLHLGRTTQVWQTEIRQAGPDGPSENAGENAGKDRLICVSRMTLAVLARK